MGRNKPKEQLGSCEVISVAETIQNAAETLNDDKLLSRISGIDLIAKEVKYHHSCKRQYVLRANRHVEQQGPKEGSKNQAHSLAFNELEKHIKSTMINNPGAELLTCLHKRYLDILSFDESTYSAQTLLNF